MRQLLQILEKVVNALTGFAAVTGGVLVGIMTLVVSYAVIARYLVNQPVGWSEEIAIYLMIWAIFLGAAYTLKHDAHIGVDLLLSNLPKAVRRYFHGFHHLAAMAFLGVLLVKGIGQVQLSLMLENRSLDLDFPLYLSQLAVPVGAALLMLQVLVKFLRLLFPEKPAGK